MVHAAGMTYQDLQRARHEAGSRREARVDRSRIAVPECLDHEEEHGGGKKIIRKRILRMLGPQANRALPLPISASRS